MRIRLALVDSDESYLIRIVAAFNKKYVDKFEIYSFTTLNAALDQAANYKVDVFIVSNSFQIDTGRLPAKCGFAYFVESTDVSRIGDVPAICKYQRADLIYKQILSLYSDMAGDLVGKEAVDSSCKTIIFTSPAGGVGTTSVAIACATRFAKCGRRVLYLNFDKYWPTDMALSADGQFDMSDIIFAIKSKKSNLSIKLESCVKRDKYGVYFYSQPKVALDMMELSTKDEEQLLSTLRSTDNYDYIIVDKGFSIEKEEVQLLQMMSEIVIVSSGSESANSKVDRALSALVIMAQGGNAPLLSRTAIFYNNFGSKTGKKLASVDVREIGGSPHYGQATIRQVIEQLSMLGDFDKLL